mgnify:CR=1 FL=1
MKRGGAALAKIEKKQDGSEVLGPASPGWPPRRRREGVVYSDNPWNATSYSANVGLYSDEIQGGSKHKSRKTKKGRGSHEGGKKKCPKHCRRHTRRTRKGLKHRKN